MMARHLQDPGGYGTVGLEVVLSIVFGVLAGRWLDGKLGTEPWIMIVAPFGTSASAACGEATNLLIMGGGIMAPALYP